MRCGDTPTIPLIVDFDLAEWKCYAITEEGSNKIEIKGERIMLVHDQGILGNPEK